MTRIYKKDNDVENTSATKIPFMVGTNNTKKRYYITIYKSFREKLPA